MIWLISALAVLVFATAAITDIRSRRIPNGLALALLALACARMLLAPGQDFGATGVDLLIGLALFVAGAALFHFGLFGGGDVKLLAAGAVWIGAASIGEYLFATALAGGALALAFVLWTFAARAFSSVAVRPSLPYGVAIAVGGVFATLAPA